VDRRIEGLREKVSYQTFNDISLIFNACVLELTEGSCLPVPVSNRDNMPPNEVMNLFYAEIKKVVGINSETLKGAISQMTLEISQGISSRLDMEGRG
jgi:hypothetical protein